MFFVWDQLVTWLMSSITGVFQIVHIEFFKFFNMNLNTFFTFIPISVLFRVFQGVGLGIAVILAMTTIMSNLMVVVTDSHEDSLKVLGRVGLATIAVLFASQIFNIVHGIFKLPFTWVNEKMSQTSSYYWATKSGQEGWNADSANNIEWNKLAENITGTDNSIAMKIVCLIIFFVLFKDFFKLLLSAAERYVVICLGSICSPLAFSTLSTKRTSSIAVSFIKLIVCQYILMMFNIMFIKGATLSFYIYTKALYKANDISYYYQNPGDAITPFVFILLVCAFLKVGQKMDQYLRTLGLDVHTMGPALGNELLSTGLGAMFMVGSVARGVAHGGLRRFGKGGASAMATGGGGNPKGKGPTGAIDELFGNAPSRTMSNLFNKGATAKGAADSFAKLKPGITQGTLQSYAGNVLANAGNQKLAALGEQLRNGDAIARMGKNGVVSVTDANGKMMTLLPNNISPEDIKKYGAQPFFDASGENKMGYVAHADTGFGMPTLEKGQSMALKDFASQDVAASIANTLGCDADDVNVIGAGGDRFALEDTASNYLGSLEMDNYDTDVVPAEFSGTATDEIGNKFMIDTAVNQDALDTLRWAGEDEDQNGLIRYGNEFYRAGDVADYINDTYGAGNDTISDESVVTGYICKDDGLDAMMDNGQLFHISNSDMEKVPVSVYTEDSTMFNGAGTQIFDSSNELNNFIEDTGVVPTTVVGGDDGTMNIRGFDRATGGERTLYYQDVSITGNKEGVINTRYGRVSPGLKG